MLYEPLMKFKDFSTQEQIELLSIIADTVPDASLSKCINTAEMSRFYETVTGCFKEFEPSNCTTAERLLNGTFTPSAMKVVTTYFEDLKAEMVDFVFSGWAYDERFVFDIEGMVYQICEDYKSAAEQGEGVVWRHDRGLSLHNMVAFEQAALLLGICEGLDF